MQVDDIFFGYSKWNFTALERFQPLFDKRLTITETLIPTPKHLQAEGLITYYDTKSPPSHLPVIVLPEEPAPAEMAAAKLLQTKLDHVLEAHNPSNDGRSSQIRILTNHFSQKAISHARLILSIGRNSLYRGLKPHSPSPPLTTMNRDISSRPWEAAPIISSFYWGKRPRGLTMPPPPPSNVLKWVMSSYRDWGRLR